LALIFDYINGFHDAANAIATVVAKVFALSGGCLGSIFNFWPTGFWFGVADTVANCNTMDINLIVILAGVIAAII
jgi:PiT family inorganic phosphate transporter